MAKRSRSVALPDLSIDIFVHYLRSVRAERTAVKYGQAAARFVQFCAVNNLRIHSLPPGVLSLFSEYLVHQGLRPRSVSVMSAGARRFLEWCRAKGALTTNFVSPDLPKILRDPPNALTGDDLLRFLTYASELHEPMRSAVLLMPFCGLRMTEMLSLRIASIQRVDAPDHAGKLAQHLCFNVKGKGGEMRVVPVLHDGRALLVHYLAGWRRTQPGTWLFPMPDGKPVSDRTIRFYVQGIRKRLGTTKKLTPHTLRRTYLTTLWRAGLDIPSLTRIAGHRSVQTTMQHYLEVRPEDLAGAVGRSGASLVSAGPYADRVNEAGHNARSFLTGLNNNPKKEPRR
jgi:site-specific recombinase XerD